MPKEPHSCLQWLILQGVYPGNQVSQMHWLNPDWRDCMDANSCGIFLCTRNSILVEFRAVMSINFRTSMMRQWVLSTRVLNYWAKQFIHCSQLGGMRLIAT
jgi:hypothetical protein